MLAPALESFGRLHPLVLHLPIGLLAGLAALEAAGALRRRPVAPDARAALAWLAAASAVLAATSGLALSREGGDGGAIIDIHKWLGLSVAATCVLAAILQSRAPRGVAAYRAALCLALLAMLPAGHFGATMTHGAGFVTEPFRRAAAAPAPNPAGAGGGAVSYAAQIAPIFEARCGACHGPARQRSNLALHTPEGITAGGKGGPVVEPGDAEASELVRRLRLPIDDEGHMPPATRPQPAAHEIELVARWIGAGAGFDEAPSAALASAAPPGASAGAPPEAFAALRDRLVHVEAVDPASPLAWIDFAAVAPAIGDGEARALLEPAVRYVGELSLARSAVTDAIAPLLAQMTELRRLDLSATACTSGALAALAALPRLEELNLSRTALGDGAVEPLAAMAALRRVHLWRCGLSDGGLADLRRRRPGLFIDAGDTAPSAPLQTEAPIALAGAAPLPGAAPVPGEALLPVNTTCPVSGQPVDPRYTIVHGGRVIGFCCPECPRRFWADPAAFEVRAP